MARRRSDPTDWKERNFKKSTLPVPLRNQVINRDDGKCQYCGKQGSIENFHGRLRVFEVISPSYRIPFEIDHADPEFAGGLNTADNLKLACRKCNRQKRTLTATDFDKWREGEPDGGKTDD